MIKDYGFIALHRAVFGHHVFENDKPFSRLHAWAWLVAGAAWCPTQVRVGRAIATLDRGQLAATTRTLADAWGWHRAKVERFLGQLRKEAMIRTRTATADPETLPETQAETLATRQFTIITICNYSKFQNLSPAENSEARHQPRHKPRRGEQQRLDLDEEFVPQPINHKTKKAKEGTGEIRGRMGRNKPRHGQRSVKNGTIWIDNGTEEWKVYAEDYRQATGVHPLPQQYIGGSGRWFNVMGEAAARRRISKTG